MKYHRFSTIVLSLLLVFPGGSLYSLSPQTTFAQTQQNQLSTANQLLRQGFEQYQKGEFSNAIALWQKALSLYQTLNNVQGEGNVLFNLGAAYLALESYPQTIEVLKAFLPISRSTRDSEGEGQALSNIGLAYESLGNYADAIRAYEQALSIMQSLKNQNWESKIFINLGNVYEKLGENNTAISFYQKSVQIAQLHKNLDIEQAALGNLGQAYANLGDYSQATLSYSKALEIARRAQNLPGQASILINLGSIYHAEKKVPQALKTLQESLAIAQQIKHRRLQAEALGSLGLLHAVSSTYPQAIQFYEQSLSFTEDVQLKARTLNNLGHSFLNSGKLVEAEKVLREALQILDQLRFGLNDSQQISIFDTQTNSYNMLQQVLAANNQPEAALEATEQGRARAFAALLAQRGFGSKALFQDAPTPNIKTIQAIAKQQQTTIIEYALIPADEFIFRGKQTAPSEAIFIWVVQPSGKISFRKVDLKQKNQSIEQLVTLSRDSIGFRSRGFVPEQPQAVIDSTAQLKELHTHLIKPIQNLLPTTPDQRVVFIPQGDLFQVPFAALQDETGKYLIEKHTILTAPSLQVLQFTQQRRQNLLRETGDILIVGNPEMPQVKPLGATSPEQLKDLPGAAQEAQAIAKLLNTQALTGKSARKVDIVPKLSTARLIHLATHGLLDDFKGLGVPGAIALAPSGTGEPNDGLLTASEISNLNLKADLVVLSACDTGRGKISADSVIGLSRSVISAGVPSVIVSLWSVPDAPTADLMTEFYRNLTEKKLDKAQSLRQAMLTVLRNPNSAAPKNWAAFTLIGEAE